MPLSLSMSLADLDRALIDMAHVQERQLRRDKLVLYAGASLLDRQQRAMMTADLSSMPYMGPPDDKEQPGAGVVSELEVFAAEMACHTFRADWAEMRLPSCTLANLAVFSFFGGSGQLLLGPSASDGGHLSQRRGGTPSLAGMEVESLPFNAIEQMLDGPAAAEQIKRRRPKMVMLGRSVILKPDDLSLVVNAARETGCIVVYDASHVLGLIAGGVFPNPLDAGVDLVTSSTYKTLHGPAGGLVLGRDKSIGTAFARFLDQQMLANQNASRLPAIISAMRFCHPDTGYARRVVDTARALKARFHERSLGVLLPEQPAATHQVVMKTGSVEATILAMQNLDAAGVLVGRCPIPGSPGHYGLRFGAQAIADLGLSSRELDLVADLIARVLATTDLDGTLLSGEDALVTETSRLVQGLLAARN